MWHIFLYGNPADGQNDSQVFFVQLISGQMPERESHFDIVIDWRWRHHEQTTQTFHYFEGKRAWRAALHTDPKFEFQRNKN